MDRDVLTESELSALYHAFRASRRRLVIQVLAEQPIEPLTTRRLAREIAGIEEEKPSKRATGEPYRNVYNSLSQTHLPSLADSDLIIYESDRQRVAPGPNFRDGLLLLTVNSAAWEMLRRIRKDNS
jgi:hypothetical protein